MSPLRLVGYFTSWGVNQRRYRASDIPGDFLTHINYAFANVSEQGECVFETPREALRDTHEFRLLKDAFPHLRILLAIGGWTFSKYFSRAVRTRETRARLIASCLRLLKNHPGVFDGFDIDWEYPCGGGLEGNESHPDDRTNLTLFLQELRQSAESEGISDLLLTIAIPASDRAFTQFELSGLVSVVDWFNIMSYDFAGPWSPVTSFHAPLFADPEHPDTLSVAEIIERLKEVVPADKLVMGIPFYGRGWSGVSASNHGLYQPYQSIPNGDAGAGCFSCRSLSKRAASFDEFWHPNIKSPWLYSKTDGVVISNENTQSITEKCRFLLSANIGGAMVWELSLDNEQHTLLRALHDGVSDSLPPPTPRA